MLNPLEVEFLQKMDDLIKDFRDKTGQLIGVQVDFDRGKVVGEIFGVEGNGKYYPIVDNKMAGDYVNLRDS
jgi:hypothetical protein